MRTQRNLLACVSLVLLATNVLSGSLLAGFVSTSRNARTEDGGARVDSTAPSSVSGGGSSSGLENARRSLLQHGERLVPRLFTANANVATSTTSARTTASSAKAAAPPPGVRRPPSRPPPAFKPKTCPVGQSLCQAADPPQRPASCNDPDPNIFEALSTAEVIQVADFVYNMVETLNMSTSEAYYGILDLDVWSPPKAAVLAYYNGTGPKPLRAAIVHILQNRTDAASGMARVALKVWPTISPTKFEYVPVIKEMMETPWRPIVISNNAYEEISNSVNDLVDGPLAAIISHVYNNASLSDECTSKCISLTYVAPPYLLPDAVAPDGYKAYYTLGLRRVKAANEDYDGTYLHAITALQFVYEAAPDAKLFKIWLMGAYFDSADDLLAFWNGTKTAATGLSLAEMKKVVIPTFANDTEAIYSTFQKRPGPVRGPPGAPLGPLVYEPYGKRFTINRNKVEWMGWSLETGVSMRGVRFNNIIFKGERIAYEISVQEALASYGAPDPGIGHIVFFDSMTYSLGYTATQLVHGVDCPVNSAYIDILILGSPVRRGMCVFEFDTTVPVLFHDPKSGTGGGGVRGTALMLRIRTTVGNYDYYQQLTLHMDGSIQADLVLTGYMTGTTYIPGLSNEYSSPVHMFIGGSLHDHTIAWKVDVDIATVANHLVVGEVTPQTFTDFAGRKWSSKKMVETTPTAEGAGTQFVLDPTKPRSVFFASEERNAWGAKRMYKLHINRPHYNVLPHDFEELRSNKWSKYMLSVTQRKDNEWTCTLDNDNDWMYDPVLDFDTYFDGESVNGTDLVAWVVSGTYHFPHSEDVPVTPTTSGNAAGFILQPYNYFDENAAMDSPELFTARGSDPVSEMIPLIQKYLANPNRCTPNLEPLFLDDFDYF